MYDMIETWLTILNLLLTTDIDIKEASQLNNHRNEKNRKTKDINHSQIQTWKINRNKIEILFKMNAAKQLLIQHLNDITNDGGIINTGIYITITKMYYDFNKQLDELNLEETKFMYILKWFIEEGSKQVIIKKRIPTAFDEFNKMKERIEKMENKGSKHKNNIF